MLAIVLISALAFLVFQARKEILGVLKEGNARIELLHASAGEILASNQNVMFVDGPRLGFEGKLLKELPPLGGQVTVIARIQHELPAAVFAAIGLPQRDVRGTGGRFVIRAGRLFAMQSDGRFAVIAVAPLAALASGLMGRLSTDLIAIGFLGVLLLLVRESRMSDYSVRRLLDSSPVPLLLLDADSGILQFANRAAFAFFADDRAGSLSELQLALRTHSHLLSWLNRIGGPGDEIATGEFEIEERPQQLRHAIVSRQSLIRHGRRVIIASFVDITVRHEAEIALKGAKEAAEALGRAKSESLAMISHELKTPVNGVLGLAQLLAEQPLPNSARRTVQRMIQAAQTLATIINDIVDIAIMDVGQVRLDRRAFDPRETILTAASLASADITRRKITVHVSTPDDLPAILVGDPDRLQQIIINLVGNGIKFTDAGGVDVDVTAATRSPDTLELAIWVRDSGIGIPAEILPRLFQPFVKAETGHRSRFGGTGLGLAICKRLSEAMGGTITVESEVGKGSTFLVRLPFSLGSPAEDPIRRAMEGNILVVDDVALNRDVVADLLRTDGYTVATAESGREAVERVLGGNFDAVLMDIRMPDMDGLSATTAIRAGENPTSPIPILGITANPLPSHVPLFLLQGIDEIVEKPVDRNKLARAMARRMTARAVVIDTRPPRIAQLLGSLGAERVRHILDGYSAVAEEAAEVIADCCTRLEFGSIVDAAHRLAGAASNIGFGDLAESAVSLEEIARLGAAPDALRAAAHTVSHFKESVRTVRVLQNALPYMGAASSEKT
jgi:signal transduction histidine kinase/CheY-like chemotaxis protein/HPt (histidine-containing phosphotransfer) domain-containing protein